MEGSRGFLKDLRSFFGERLDFFIWNGEGDVWMDEISMSWRSIDFDMKGWLLFRYSFIEKIFIVRMLIINSTDENFLTIFMNDLPICHH